MEEDFFVIAGQAEEGAAVTRGHGSRGSPLQCETAKELLAMEGRWDKKGDHKRRENVGRTERWYAPARSRGSEALKESDTSIAWGRCGRLYMRAAGALPKWHYR